MNFAVIATSVLAATILLLGVVIIIRTQIFNGLAQYAVRPWGIAAVSAIRLFAAVVLWLAAPASRFPGTFKVLAVVALIAGVGVLLVGRERVAALVEWSTGRPPSVLRLFAGIAMAVGGFILWALWR